MARLPRRTFLHLALAAATLQATSRVALAQAYPTRVARIIVGFPAGGPNDIIARLMGQWLSERLGQQFVIENRAGAGSTIAAEVVVKSPPDGYTLLLVGAPNAINATLYEKLNYNFIRDIAPVAAITRVPNVIVAHPSVPANTVSELIAYAKAHPGKLTMASSGIGSSGHVSGELFKLMAGVNMLHVPYRGGPPAVSDLIGGQVDVLFHPLPGMSEFIRAGSLRALAVTGATRSAVLPDVPSVGEFVEGYEASSWFGIGAPVNTPVAIVDKLNREVIAGVADAKLSAQLAELGGEAISAVSPADFGKLIAGEIEKWAKVVKFAGLKAD